MTTKGDLSHPHSRVTAGAKRWQLWVVGLAAASLVVGGLVGSILTAKSVVRNDTARSKAALATSSAEVASTLRLAIQREQDLAVSATGYFLASPGASNAEFLAWASAVDALNRYPELLGWGQVVMVTAAQLKAYEALAAADPAGVVSGPFSLVPPGERPFYCLFSVGQNRTPGTGAPAGFDYCAGAAGVPIIAARDSGLSSYQAVDTGNGAPATLAVQVPFYRGGVVPSTVEARRAAFAGWGSGSTRRSCSTRRCVITRRPR